MGAGNGQESMLGATKTAHSIFLLERGGQVGPTQPGHTSSEHVKTRPFFFSTVHSSSLSPPYYLLLCWLDFGLWTLEYAYKSKNKAVERKGQAERKVCVWQTSSVAHCHF